MTIQLYFGIGILCLCIRIWYVTCMLISGEFKLNKLGLLILALSLISDIPFWPINVVYVIWLCIHKRLPDSVKNLEIFEEEES